MISSYKHFKYLCLQCFENGETNLEPLDGHAKDREEAGDDGDDEESVDQLVLEWLDELVFDRMAGHHDVGLSEGI